MEAWSNRLGADAAEAYPRLRVIATGGDAVPGRLPEQLRRQFGQAQLLQFYGPTEATVIEHELSEFQPRAGSPVLLGRAAAEHAALHSGCASPSGAGGSGRGDLHWWRRSRARVL